MQNASRSLTKSSLSPSKAHLVKLMQRINHGCIKELVVREGEPVLDPPPRVIRSVKFGGENGARPESAKGDFVLKEQVLDLFEWMKSMQNGVIRHLEIKHGLPFRMDVEEDAA